MKNHRNHDTMYDMNSRKNNMTPIRKVARSSFQSISYSMK